MSRFDRDDEFLPTQEFVTNDATKNNSSMHSNSRFVDKRYFQQSVNVPISKRKLTAERQRSLNDLSDTGVDYLTRLRLFRLIGDEYKE